MTSNDEEEVLSRLHSWMYGCRQSKSLLVTLVAVTFLLDYMLLTTIIPIMPEYIYNLEHPDLPIGDSIKERQYTPKTSKLYATTYEYCDFKENATVNNTTIIHKDIMQENVLMGIMFATKPLFQIIANPFVGALTNRIGFSIPMFVGLIIMLASTIVFPFAENFIMLLTARALQGIGSSFTTVSGFGLIAEYSSDEKKRETSISYAVSGISVGLLIGSSFGGAMYQFFGYSSPFLVISGLIICNEVLLLFVLPPTITRSEIKGPSIVTLLSDSYVMIAAGAITIGNLGMGVLEASLPIWMIDIMGATRLEQGLIYLPDTGAYLVSALVFGRFGHLIDRWLCAFIGLVVVAICLVAMTFAKSVAHIIAPNAGIGFGIGMIENSMLPELAHLVDIRHSSVYGNVYAIGSFSISLGFLIGPAVSAALVANIGFQFTLIGVAIVSLLFAPLLFKLRDPPTKEETNVLIGRQNSNPSISYQG